MCGIIGYVGNNSSLPILLDGLKKLEQFGYDSTGLATVYRNDVKLFKSLSGINHLRAQTESVKSGSLGVAHTRIATVADISLENAHPHRSTDGRIVLVHNGTIDNWEELSETIISSDCTGWSDSKILTEFIALNFKVDISTTLVELLPRIRGTFGIVGFDSSQPNELFCAVQGSILYIHGEKGRFSISSHFPKMHGIEGTKLSDGEFAIVSDKGYVVHSFAAFEPKSADRDVSAIKSDIEKFEKTIKQSLGNGGRLSLELGTAKLSGFTLEGKDVLGLSRIVCIGEGSSYFAAQYASYMIENHARIPSYACHSQELLDRNPVVNKSTLFLVYSNSGETLETVQITEELSRRNARIIGIVNSVSSTVARLAGQGIYLHSDPELSFPGIKTFGSQLMVSILLTLFLGRFSALGIHSGSKVVREILRLDFSSTPDIPMYIKDAIEAKKKICFVGTSAQLPILQDICEKIQGYLGISSTVYTKNAINPFTSDSSWAFIVASDIQDIPVHDKQEAWYIQHESGWTESIKLYYQLLLLIEHLVLMSSVS
jgi:glucosamine--fructose-6-phosphate aminotransferase (isomerizing)